MGVLPGVDSSVKVTVSGAGPLSGSAENAAVGGVD